MSGSRSYSKDYQPNVRIMGRLALGRNRFRLNRSSLYTLKRTRQGTMAGLRQTTIRGGLESLYFTGAHWALKPLVGGVGAILTLHHVRPQRPARFQPNRLLEVTPEFLAGVVRYLRRSSLESVSLDEMHRRMTERDFSRRFVCITFDDGY